jgi:uncharacterized phiE125 gp8 family phage protein
MLLKRTAAPAAEPVSTSDAKAHLRITHATEDTLVARLVKAAREHVEDRTGRALVTQTWKMWLRAFPRSGAIELPRPPLVSVTSITYLDADGASQTLSSDAYAVYPEGFKGRVKLKAGESWPATAEDEKAVEITFEAGYGDAAAVPAAVTSAMLLLVEHLYHNRGETGDGPITVNPVASERLLGPLMTHGWI